MDFGPNLRMDEPEILPAPSCVLLVTHTRTASNLLQRMLSKQPNCLYGSHFFGEDPQGSRMLARKRAGMGIQDEELDQRLLLQNKESYLKFLNLLKDAKDNGQIAFMHIQPHTMIASKLAAEPVQGTVFSVEDHKFWSVGSPDQQHTNFMVVPDDALLQPGTRPIILFRHPVLMTDGIFRAFQSLAYADDHESTRRNLTMGATLRWMRLIYDWYLEKGGPLQIKPILVEADDYMGPRKETVMEELCEQAGLDASSVIYSWPKATAEELKVLTPPQELSFRTINSSERILSGNSLEGKDMNEEMMSWDDKYGQEWAELMRDLVRKAMPDYEYLRARRTVGV